MMPLGHANLDPRTWLAGFIKGITKYCYTRNIKAMCLIVSEKKIFLCFSYCVGANDPRCVANLDTRGQLRKICFSCYSHYKPLADNDAPGS